MPQRHALSLFLLIWVGVPTPPANAADWPQFLGPGRDGVYDGEIATTWPSGGPKALWRRKVGAGFSAPVVAGQRLLIFHRPAPSPSGDGAGGQDGASTEDQDTLECLDARSGKAIWRKSQPSKFRDSFGFHSGPRATPTVAADQVFTFGADGNLACREFATGKLVWNVATHEKFSVPEGFFGASCSPLVHNGQVIVNVGGRNGNGIVAFDAKTGKVVWSADSDEASYASPVVASIAGKEHLLVLTRANLLDLHPEDGTIGFRFPFRARIHASVNAASPLVIDDLVFVTASYRTGAAALRISSAGKEKVWSSKDVLSCHYATPVVYDRHLYGFDGRQEHGAQLRAVELETGKVAWTQTRFGSGTITVARDLLVILTEAGDLVIAPAKPSRFEEIARANILPATVRANPALAQGILYARNQDTLVAIDLRPRSGGSR